MTANASAADPPRDSSTSAELPPLVMHVVYRFGVGGLENGVVNLVNRLPREEFRHMIVALTECDEDFGRRIERQDVELVSLRKPAGHGWKVFRAMMRLIRRHKPAIVHTRNLAALEMQLPAWIAGVGARIHGEHGRDMSDPDGLLRKYRLLRRLYAPFVTHFVTVSRDLERYLTHKVRIRSTRVTRICNGVDEERFFGGAGRRLTISAEGRADSRVVVGTVGRLQEIKGQHVLLDAVAALLQRAPHWGERLRVRIVGEGPLRPVLECRIAELGLADIVELVGERNDVAAVMKGFDLFVLPSLGEGISNTILEAMATGLAVIATEVGGNVELVTPNETGMLVPPNDPDALANALERYLGSPQLRAQHGGQARATVEREFSLSAMVERYRALYHAALSERRLAASR